MPGYSPERAFVFRTARAVLVLHRFLVYPNGVEFTLTLHLREPLDHHDVPWELRRPPPARGPLPDDFLRLGVLFPDGTKWTNLHWHVPFREGPPPGPVIVGRGGGGGEHSWDMDYWMWPLPPAGPLTVVAEWPAYDVPETRVEVDGAAIRAAAAGAEVIWPD